MISMDAARLGWAALAVCLYLALVAATLLRVRRARGPAPAQGHDHDWLVAYASQTGTAEFLARQTAQSLHSAGVAVRCVDVAALDRASLHRARRLLIVASTYGEGDPPDSAARLTRLLDDPSLSLSQLHVGLLALGDAGYRQFCGYGHALEAQLRARGASLLFTTVEANRRAPAALAQWQHHLSHLAGTVDAPDWSGPPYQDWRIVARTLVNPGSAGAPVWAIDLHPAAGALPDWQAGDLVQVCPPGQADAPREYSIAGTRAEDRLQLLVRLHRRKDGSTGAASGWLCGGAQADDTVTLRLRDHPNFRLGENAGAPLILIGNGTGIAGLRSLLKQRIDAGQHRNWLLFGERSAAHDRFYEHDLAAWQAAGALPRLDLAYSRDGVVRVYVQDLLAANETDLRAWCADGAAIYVCGSLQGMAGAVHGALAAILGESLLSSMQDAGRYRRDVY